MSDFVIRESDGWFEITELVELAISRGGLTESQVWGIGAQGDMSALARLLIEAFENDPDEELQDFVDNLTG